MAITWSSGMASTFLFHAGFGYAAFTYSRSSFAFIPDTPVLVDRAGNPLLGLSIHSHRAKPSTPMCDRYARCRDPSTRTSRLHSPSRMSRSDRKDDQGLLLLLVLMRELSRRSCVVLSMPSKFSWAMAVCHLGDVLVVGCNHDSSRGHILQAAHDVTDALHEQVVRFRTAPSR